MVYIFRELQEVYDQNLCLIPEFMVTFGKYVLTLIFFFRFVSISCFVTAGVGLHYQAFLEVSNQEYIDLL